MRPTHPHPIPQNLPTANPLEVLLNLLFHLTVLTHLTLHNELLSTLKSVVH